MSILNIPIDILLEIFEELENIDLKNLRLSHSSFRQVTAARLFRELELNFGSGHLRQIDGDYWVDDGTQAPELSRRLRLLVSDSETAHPFRGVRSLQKLSVIYQWKEANLEGFRAFATTTWLPFLRLFDRIGALKLFVTNSTLYHAKRDVFERATETTEIFFKHFATRLHEGMSIDSLDVCGDMPRMDCIEGARGLHSLRVDFCEMTHAEVNCPGERELNLNGETGAQDRKEAEAFAAMYKVIGRAIANNVATLESLQLGWNCNVSTGRGAYNILFGTENNHPNNVRGFLDLILDCVPDGTVLPVKFLKLGGTGGFPPEHRNLRKLANLQKMEGCEASETYIQLWRPSLWDNLKAAGIKLESVSSDLNTLTAAYLDYIAFAASREGGVKEITLPRSWRRAANQFDSTFRFKICNNVLPNVRTTLRSLSMSAEVIPNDGALEVICDMLEPSPEVRQAYETALRTPHARPLRMNEAETTTKRSQTFKQLMRIFRGFPCLKDVHVYIGQREATSYVWRCTQQWKEGIMLGWKARQLFDRDDDWREGMKITFDCVDNGQTWKLGREEDGYWRLKGERSWCKSQSNFGRNQSALMMWKQMRRLERIPSLAQKMFPGLT